MNISSKVAESEEYILLSEHLKGDSDLNATLSRFTNPLVQALENSSPPYSLSEEDSNTHLERAWSSVLLLASRTPHDSPKQAELIKFMTKMVQQIPLEDPNGKTVEIGGSKLWTDLPLFGQQARECWNIALDKEVDQETREKWINVNAFVARLTAAYWAVGSGKQSVDTWVNADALDFSLYGIWMLRSALEDEIKRGSTGDASIGAAAMWLVYAGPAMKGLSEKGKEFEGKKGKAGGKFKQKEWRGYTTDRWQVWGEELEKVQSLAEDKDVEALVTKAREAYKQK